ncbi:SapB/AmfS family lanthipeptide [Streptomyces syringium]
MILLDLQILECDEEDRPLEFDASIADSGLSLLLCG